MKHFQNRHLKRGQGLVEYILMVFLIGLLVYGAVKTFGGSVKTAFGQASSGLDDAVGSSTAGGSGN